MQGDLSVVVSQERLVGRREGFALALTARAPQGEIIGAEHHVLRGHGDGLAVLRLEQIVGGEHEKPRFGLRLGRERDVNGHLIAVKVGVVGGADQRVQLDGAALDQNGLKGLNAQTVQRGGAVE